MKYFSDEDIQSLDIGFEQCKRWVREAFLAKKASMLPRKISQKFNNGKNFYNTMPTIIPSLNCAGVKIVSRYPRRTPSISGHLLLYSYENGELLSMMDATWITVSRTGAVSALAAETFAAPNSNTVAVIGLGQTGLAFLDAYLSNPQNRGKNFKLKKYKTHIDRALRVIEKHGDVAVEVCETNERLIRGSDIIVSCVTVSETLMGKDEYFKEGALVIPVHTRGFQNCDLFFDRVFADDASHIRDFKHFGDFRYFNEFSEVLSNNDPGRVSEAERILSYNIGIALHDILFARRIYDIFSQVGS